MLSNSLSINGHVISCNRLKYGMKSKAVEFLIDFIKKLCLIINKVEQNMQ